MNPQTIDLLLTAGSNPNGTSRGWPALHHAIDMEMDSVLQALQRDPTPAELPEPIVVARLLAAGADPSVRDADGQTAIEFATAYGHTRAVAIMRSHTQVT